MQFVGYAVTLQHGDMSEIAQAMLIYQDVWEILARVWGAQTSYVVTFV